MSARYFQSYWACPHCGDSFLRLRWVSKDKSKAAYECEACELEHVRCTYTIKVFDWRTMREREDGYASEQGRLLHREEHDQAPDEGGEDIPQVPKP
jgi:transcription elongation factor Elf1